jgi:hypothetical protein
VDSELALLRLVVRAVLGAEAEPLLAILNQAKGLLLRILRHPLPFVRTLLAAGRQGFTAFVAKAPAYLQNAAQHWLFGSLVTEGLPVPKTWTPRALLELLLAVLGLSKAHVLARLEAQLRAQVGPAAAGRIQQLGGAARTLWQQGPAGLWQELTAQTRALLPQALGAVQGRITQLLATGVARLLVKLALPGGALVQVLRTGYDVYETLVARAREPAQVGRTLFALAGSLAQGAVARPPRPWPRWPRAWLSSRHPTNC